MGLSWQQGLLSPGRVGRFLVPDPVPDRLIYAEPLGRRMRVRFGGAWIADSEQIVLLHEPGRYPVAYFPQDSIAAGALQPGEYTTHHRDLGPTAWYTVRAGRIHTEIFGSAPPSTPGVAHSLRPPPHTLAGPPGTGPLVSFARSGLNVRWRSDFRSLLELAEACDVPVRWSCRTGVYHTCETGLVEGTVSYKPAPIAGGGQCADLLLEATRRRHY